MGRNKQDFVNYAKSFTGRSNVGGAITESNIIIERNENVSGSLWGANERDDQSDEISGGISEAAQYASGEFARQEQGNYTGIYGGDASSYGVTDTDGQSNSFDGNGGYSSREYTEAIPGNIGYGGATSLAQPKIRRTRTSLVDNTIKAIGNKLPHGKQKQQAVAASPVARKLITLAEVSKYKPILVALILSTSESLDNGISAITRGHREIEIWSNLEYSDAVILADLFLDAGQKSIQIASQIRLVIEYQKKAKALIILVPRLYKSVMYTVLTGIDIRM